MSLRPRFDQNVETSTDPFALIAGAKDIFAALREFMVDADDRRGGWRSVLARDPRVHRMVLDQLAYAGEFLARLTVLVDELVEIQELADADLADVGSEGARST